MNKLFTTESFQLLIPPNFAEIEKKEYKELKSKAIEDLVKVLIKSRIYGKGYKKRYFTHISNIHNASLTENGFEKSPLGKLPNETLGHILSLLPLKDYCRSRQVCKIFNAVHDKEVEDFKCNEVLENRAKENLKSFFSVLEKFWNEGEYLSLFTKGLELYFYFDHSSQLAKIASKTERQVENFSEKSDNLRKVKVCINLFLEEKLFMSLKTKLKSKNPFQEKGIAKMIELGNEIRAGAQLIVNNQYDGNKVNVRLRNYIQTFLKNPIEELIELSRNNKN